MLVQKVKQIMIFYRSYRGTCEWMFHLNKAKTPPLKSQIIVHQVKISAINTAPWPPSWYPEKENRVPSKGKRLCSWVVQKSWLSKSRHLFLPSRSPEGARDYLIPLVSIQGNFMPFPSSSAQATSHGRRFYPDIDCSMFPRWRPSCWPS